MLFKIIVKSNEERSTIIAFSKDMDGIDTLAEKIAEPKGADVEYIGRLLGNDFADTSLPNVSEFVSEPYGEDNLEVWLFNNEHRYELHEAKEICRKNSGWDLTDALDSYDSDLYNVWCNTDTVMIKEPMQTKSIDIVQIKNDKGHTSIQMTITYADGSVEKREFISSEPIAVTV